MGGRLLLVWEDGGFKPIEAEGLFVGEPSFLEEAAKHVEALRQGRGVEWEGSYDGSHWRFSLFPVAHAPLKAVLVAQEDADEDWREGLLGAIEDFRERLARARRAEEIYDALVEAAVRAVPGAEAGSFWLAEQKGFRLVAAHGFDPAILGAWLDGDEQRAWFGDDGDEPRVLLEPARFSRLDPELQHLAGIRRIQATLSVPIRVQGRVYGYLNLDRFSEGAAFGPRARRAAKIFSAQAAALVAVYERDRLRRFKAERLRWLARAGRLGQALRRMPPDDPLAWAQEVLGKEFAEVEVEVLAGGEVPSAVQSVLDTDGVVFAKHVAYLRLPGAGAVLRFRPRGREDFPQGFHGFLSAFLEGLKLARERNQALAEAREKSEAYRQLLAMSNLLESETDPERIVRETLELLLALTRSDTGIFTRVEDGRLRPAYLSGSFSQQMLRAYEVEPPALGEGAVGQAVAYGRYVAVEDYPNWPGALPTFRRLGIKSVYVVPIWLDGKPYGALELLQFKRRRLSPVQEEVFKLAGRRLLRMLERAEHLSELKRTREAILRTFGLALEHRDLETQGHTDRVVRLATALGRRLGYRGSWLEALRWGAYLHDVGKLALPDAILLKPGELADYEWEVVKKHPLIGTEMLRNLRFLPDITLNVVRYHHERWDGSGYPEGLKGTGIPEEARIFAVVDVFDALVSPRPYKDAWSPERALAELERQAGKTLDPRAVEAFTEAMRSGELALPPAG